MIPEIKEHFGPKLEGSKPKLTKIHTKEAQDSSQLDTGSTNAQDEEDKRRGKYSCQSECNSITLVTIFSILTLATSTVKNRKRLANFNAM